MKTLGRFIILALVLALVTAFVPACSKQAAERVLVIGTTDSVTTLDPADAYDYLSSNILNNVAENLVTYKPGTTEIIPGLATEWTVSDDGLVYVFKLREGVKFHDGNTCNAEAVKFSLDRAIGLKGDPWFLLDDIDKIEVTGDYEVKITLKYPSSPFLSKLAYTVACIVSPAAYSATEKNPTAVVGTGPYKLGEWKEGEYITLLANPDYWGEKPYADTVTVKFYSNSAALKLAVENKEVDIAYRSFVPLEEESLKANPNLNCLEGPSPAIRYLVLNVTKPPFDNVHVRRAIALAVDRAAINDQVFKGTVSPLYSMVPDGMWSYKPVFKADKEPDIDGALAELAEAGYSPANPLKFEFWYTPTHYGDTEADLAQVLKSQFEATGAMQVELMSSEWGRYTDDLVAGSMGILLLGWYPDYFDPDDYLSPFLSTEGAKSMGSFYSSETMDELLRQEVSLTTVEERTPVLEQVQDLLAQDIPNVPLFQKPQFVAFQKDVKGVILDPLQIFRYYLITKDGWQ